MRASFTEINQSVISKRKVGLVYKSMVPVFVQHKHPLKRYKKVGKQTKEKLLDVVQKGESIISVSRRFGINYSTAKSIIQIQKKKRKASEQHPSAGKGSETDECQSSHPPQ